MNIVKRIQNGERGAAIVEAAIVLPILLVLTFGIWQTSRAWNVQSSLNHAAREAARYGATIDPWDGTNSPIAIRGVFDSDLSVSAIDTTLVNTVCIEKLADTAASCDASHTNNTGTDQIFVSVQYPNYVLDFVFFRSTVSMEATALARFEAGP